MEEKKHTYRTNPILTGTTVAERQDIFLAALADHNGLVRRASAACGISHETHYNWKRNDPVYAEKAEATRDYFVDLLEDQLVKNVQDGKEASTIFGLKCLGKKRGWREQDTLQVSHKIEQIMIMPSSEGLSLGDVTIQDIEELPTDEIENELED